MKKLSIAASLLCVLALMSGCSHYYYAPNTANIPLFKEKNTFQGKAGYSWDDYQGGDVQMAYSVSKNIGIMVNSFFAGSKEQVPDNLLYSNDTHEESGKGSYIEAAAGYYKPLGEQKVWIFETYAGAGTGGENHAYANSETAKLHLTKFFVQPSIGYSSKSGHVEVALGSRFSLLNLKVKESKLAAEANKWEQQNLDAVTLHPSSILWEPSLIVGAGWQNFKFYLQLTPSYNLNNPDLVMDPGNISLGIKFTIKSNQKKGNSNSDYISPAIN